MVEEQTQIRGYPVPVAGTYVLLDDVVSALRAYAQSLEDPNAGGLIHDLATWLDGGDPTTITGVPGDAPSATRFKEATVAEPYVHGAEPDDVTLDVSRVEIFPDPPDDPRPKWYARSIDTGGHILKTTGGSFDYDWVVSNAQERWPGIEIHLLRAAGDDSMWNENQTSAMFKNGGNRGAFPSVGPPVRRLWEGVSG